MAVGGVRLFGKEVLIDALHLVHFAHLHTHIAIDHLRRESLPVDENKTVVNTVEPDPLTSATLTRP